jgi:uncharacterized protein (DUF1800 family)
MPASDVLDSARERLPSSWPPMGAETAALLLRRATWGPSPATLAAASRVSLDSWLRAQLSPATLPDPRMDAIAPAWPLLGRTVAQATAAAGGVWTGEYLASLVEHTIARSVWSERQLFEQMVYLWSNHLNVSLWGDGVHLSRHSYDAVVRKHALGRFSDLLVAATTHPAMLRYLNADSSRAGRVNENLGRELLELHTVGVGNHTEADVKQSALALTGLSIDRTTGEFMWQPKYRYVGPLTVGTWSHPNGSAADGLAVVRSYLTHLALHPSTARRVATKLAVRFVSDTPPAALVDRLTAVYLSNQSAIVPVLMALFTSKEFRDSAGAKVRTPHEDLAATLRVLKVPAPTVATARSVMQACRWTLDGMGHQPLAWRPPNGYPDVAGPWISPSTMLGRFNMHLSVAAGWWPKFEGYTGPASVLGAPVPATHGELVDAMAARLLVPEPSTTLRTALCAFFEVTPTTAINQWSPMATWRIGHLVALLLDHPSHTIR